TVARETAYRNNQSLTASIENNIARTFEGYDLSVQALIANFQRANVSTLRPELRQLLLFDRFAFTPHLASISVLDTHGDVVADSRTTAPHFDNRGTREYFKAHLNSDQAGLYISRPFMARSVDSPVVTLSRRLSNPDGTFAGIVAASLKLSYFNE